MRGGWARHVLAGTAVSVALLSLGSCGGDDCDSCSGALECPRLSKTCPGFTATVQQCTGSCCVTKAEDISCSSLRAAAGTYALVGGEVRFSDLAGDCGLRITIDPAANGWSVGSRSLPEQRAAIIRRMAEAMPNAVPR